MCVCEDLLTYKHKTKLADLICQMQQPLFCFGFSGKLYKTTMVLLFAKVKQIFLLRKNPYRRILPDLAEFLFCHMTVLFSGLCYIIRSVARLGRSSEIMFFCFYAFFNPMPKMKQIHHKYYQKKKQQQKKKKKKKKILSLWPCPKDIICIYHQVCK